MQRTTRNHHARAICIATLLTATLAAADTAGAVKAARPSTLGNGQIDSITAAAHGSFQSPRDSTPTADGASIYFTATGGRGQDVFRVSAAGSAVTPVLIGSPFVAPRGIAISADDRWLYVADPGAGRIFVLPAAGGTPRTLRGSNGTAPQSMAVVTQSGAPRLYFSSMDPTSGRPAVLSLPTSGATAATVVHAGAPLVSPDGVAVTRTGLIYVADRSAAGNGLGAVFALDADKASAVARGVRLGSPAGIALNLDESLLLVSAHPTRATAGMSVPDEVLVIDLSTLKTGAVTMVVGANTRAGGVHRALRGNILSWADLTAGGTGTVYRVVFK